MAVATAGKEAAAWAAVVRAAAAAVAAEAAMAMPPVEAALVKGVALARGAR